MIRPKVSFAVSFVLVFAVVVRGGGYCVVVVAFLDLAAVAVTIVTLKVWKTLFIEGFKIYNELT